MPSCVLYQFDVPLQIHLTNPSWYSFPAREVNKAQSLQRRNTFAKRTLSSKHRRCRTNDRPIRRQDFSSAIVERRMSLPFFVDLVGAG